MDALAHSPWPPGLLYAVPPVPPFLPLLDGVVEEKRRIFIVAPEAPKTSWNPLLASLDMQPPWPVPLRQDALSQAGGQIMRPHPQRLPTLGMADARMRWEADGFSPGVVETMMQNWAPSTMANYDPKWAHFKRWCCDMQRDPFTCPLPRCSDTSNTRSRKVLCPLQ